MKRLVLIAMVVLLSASSVIAQCDWDYFYPNCRADLDHDCDIDANDVVEFLNEFGRNQFLMPCPPNGPSLVEKTGQTTSYATGDDGDFEKGVAWPNPRFNDRGNGTVVDNLTGLTWLKNANCFGTRNWNLALSDSNGLAEGACGLTDGSQAGEWRLPNRNELNSLVDIRFSNPAISDTAGTGQWSEDDPFTNVQSNVYWSSTTTAGHSPLAWYAIMDLGTVNLNAKSYNCYVWPVRGGH
jgi:hypothetical protein